MRLSRKSIYALRALIAIARQDRSWQIQELSRVEAIPVKFLEQILLALRHAGLLASKRGLGGGYTLRQAASHITVAEVITLMDGPYAPVPCAAEHPSEPCVCPDQATCPLRTYFTTVRQAADELLKGQTIADLVAHAPSFPILAYEI